MNDILKAIGEIMAAFNVPEVLGQAVLDFLAQLSATFEGLFAGLGG
ncbi:MAG: hypothetical protein LBQ33_01700 [Oscillospiraceae bacterium]|jgi:hypothetical protein|nr:hypothetical protein [Oscillospiraceae bacterium]